MSKKTNATYSTVDSRAMADWLDRDSMDQHIRAQVYDDIPEQLGEPQAQSGTDRRRFVLQIVEACVCKDRQNTYGDAEVNFVDIGGIASIVLADYLKKPLDAKAVAIFQAAIKMARLKASPTHLDNWVDLAGYAVCGAGIVVSEQ